MFGKVGVEVEGLWGVGVGVVFLLVDGWRKSNSTDC